MRKQKRTLFILLAVLAALILLILFVIPNLGRPQAASESENRIQLCTLDRSEIQRIIYTAEGATRTLTLSGGMWLYEDGSAETQDTVSKMLSAVSGLYSTQIAYSGAEHLAACGLDAPALTIIAYGSGTSVTLTVGSYNNALDRWYCTVNGGTDIYLIGNNLSARFGISQ